MKRLLIIAFVLINMSANAQYVSISDAAFLNWIDVNHPGAVFAGQLDTTNAGILSETFLNPLGAAATGFTNIDGIKYFKACTTLYIRSKGMTGLAALPPNLEILDCRYNNIDSLPSLPNTLQELICFSNDISSLPDLPSGLTYLNCSTNDIQVLPSLPNGLKEVHCIGNQLTSMPALPDSLTILDCTSNFLNSLPALPTGLQTLLCGTNSIDPFPVLPSTLETFDCYGNNLTMLPSLPAGLKFLSCRINSLDTLLALPPNVEILLCNNNQLQHLPSLPNSIVTLECGSNQLSYLPTLPSNLDRLLCEFNQINSLPTLPSSLKRLDCENNGLDSLPLLPPLLEFLQCNNNALVALPVLPTALDFLYCPFNNITQLPDLPASLTRLYCTNNQLNCLPPLPDALQRFQGHSGNAISCWPNHPTNYTSGSFGNDPPLTLCDINSVCSIYLNASGSIFIDSIANGVLDPGERLVCRGQVNINPGSFMTGCYNGKWGYILDNNVPYDVSVPNNTSYYTIVPDSHNVLLTNTNPFDTTLNFALQAINLNSNDLCVNIVALQGLPRPGFQYKLRLHYVNPGTFPQNASIELNYNGSVINFISASQNPSVNTIGFLEFQLGNLYMLDEGFIDLTFIINANTTLGTLLNFDATIFPNGNDLTPDNNMSLLSVVAVGSYDPNDKLVSVTEISPQQVLNQKYLEYTIRFQNTGTASAINVRLTDSLSSYLDWNSFEQMSSSHSNVWSLDSGMLVVRYDNIHLPDSNANEEESHGYFKYRVKVNDDLMVGYEIFNYADIFFDFNAPIRTDTTVTEVTITTSYADSDINMELILSPNPSTGLVNIDLGEMKDVSVRVFDVHGQLIKQIANINNNSYQFELDEAKGVYFIEVSSIDIRRFGKLVIR